MTKLDAARLVRAEALLMRGTIPMIKSVNRYAEHWRVEFGNHTGNISHVSYEIDCLPDVLDMVFPEDETVKRAEIFTLNV